MTPALPAASKAALGLTHGKKRYAPEVGVRRMSEAWHERGDKRDAAPPDAGA